MITYAAVPNLEVEVKLEAREVSGVPSRMTGIGGVLLHPREFEDNRLYDFPDRSLMGRGAILRVRTTGRSTILTYKDRARAEGGVKIREEVETAMAVTAEAPLSEILQRIGMEVIFRYQKYRTTWKVRGLLATLDETPIGAFIELEGGRDVIGAVAVSLGYTEADYIAASYRDLYVTSLSRAPGPVDRMIFPDRAGAGG